MIEESWKVEVVHQVLYGNGVLGDSLSLAGIVMREVRFTRSEDDGELGTCSPAFVPVSNKRH